MRLAIVTAVIASTAIAFAAPSPRRRRDEGLLPRTR